MTETRETYPDRIRFARRKRWAALGWYLVGSLFLCLFAVVPGMVSDEVTSNGV